MRKPAKLELAWIGKENRPKLEPRILLEDLPASRLWLQARSSPIMRRIASRGRDRFQSCGLCNNVDKDTKPGIPYNATLVVRFCTEERRLSR
jgi:hypothetical protein